LVDIPESIKSSAELYRGKLRNFKAMTESKGCSSKQGMEQSSTSKQAKNQRTMMTAIDIAERSILKHDQRKQQSLTAGSSIQVEGSVQIQHKKQDDRTGFQTCFSNHYLSIIIIIAPFITAIFICDAIVMLLAATFWLLKTITLQNLPYSLD
jgi:hypothetical protein